MPLFLRRTLTLVSRVYACVPSVPAHHTLDLVGFRTAIGQFGL